MKKDRIYRCSYTNGEFTYHSESRKGSKENTEALFNAAVRRFGYAVAKNLLDDYTNHRFNVWVNIDER